MTSLIKAHQKKAAKEKNNNKESLIKKAKGAPKEDKGEGGKANLQGEGQPEQQEKKYV